MKRNTDNNDPLFQLIKVLTKAEKRNFRLFVSRQTANEEAKFVALFGVIDSLDHYDERRILEKTGFTKEQLSNTKTHLYDQILISCRLLGARHSKTIELREQVDFAKILYDKGLLRQSLKILEKAKRKAIEWELYTIAVEIVEMEKDIEIQSNTKDSNTRADLLSGESKELTRIVGNINALSNITVQLYGLHMQLGFARSERDLNLLETIFLPRIIEKSKVTTSLERMQLYHALMWYTYIRYDFVSCYKYASKILSLYKRNPNLFDIDHDTFLKAYSRKMETLYLLGSYHHLIQTVKEYEEALPALGLNDNAKITAEYLLYENKVNIIFIQGSFTENIGIADNIEKFIDKNEDRLGIYEIAMLHYKIACIYFGVGDYDRSLHYLQKIIAIRGVVIRRDIMCFARILNLIASYESANDINLDQQIKNVYSYLIKMNDMYTVQREMIEFLKRVYTVNASDVKGELKKLYNKLKPYEGESYEQRPFLYMDILSWLKSKIEGKKFEKVMQEKFHYRVLK